MSELPPTVRPPLPADLRSVAATFSMDLTDEEVADYVAMAERTMAVYERLEAMDEPAPPRVEAERAPGSRPSEDEDPHNAFVTRCTVRSDAAGPLDGWRVAVKDNVAVAGVGMTCGSRVLSGYVPSADATVVRRLLRAGGTVVGKTNMDDMAVSGAGELTATGHVRNPRDPDHLAGGSSGGSAASVVTGDADVAIGTDQAGSVRIPAAWCGCVGFKPTFGLVPYTGIVGLGHTFDHAGPLAGSVDDCARLLDVIAGPDPLDPRKGFPTAAGDGDAADFAEAAASDPGDVAVGVLAEGFDHDDGDPGVDAAVHDAIDGLPGDRWTDSEVSVPEHDDGMAVWVGVATEENTALIRDEGVGHFVDGYYDTQFADAFGRARRGAADDFPPTLKVRLLLGGYLSEAYRGRFHAKAQNLRRSLRAAYDEALDEVDVLALPTVPKTAHEVVEGASRRELVRRGRDMGANTAPFNMTGHPAITVPCGTVNGLPVGLMLVGERGADGALLSAARAVERQVSPYC